MKKLSLASCPALCLVVLMTLSCGRQKPQADELVGQGDMEVADLQEGIQRMRTYDYSEAIADMQAAVEILPDIPYIWFNLGNLRCLSSSMVEAIESYDQAIRLYPYMGDAYYNRGLVLIYLKDREKGCIDLSRAGELGVADAYSVIKKYCESDAK